MPSLARKATLAAALLGTLAAPARSQSESYNFDYYCSMGSMMVCASVRIQSVDNVLTMQVWNLNGTLGVAHTITDIGLYHAGYDWTGSVNSANVTYYQQGGGTQNISQYWTAKGANDIGNLGGVKIELADGTSGNKGIIGCTDPGGQIKWATCWNGNSSFDDRPYVQFTFNLSSHFALNDLQLRWHSQQLPNGSSIKCDTGGAGDYPACRYRPPGTPPPPPSSVPEPATMTLVGTGLLGVAGFMRRRRKTA